MANDPVAAALSKAKTTLAHANSSFPGTGSSAVSSPTPSPAPVKSTPTIGQELAVKKGMVDKARTAIPKMHVGGPVPADGTYDLQAGEHVLTAPQAKMVRKHALMSVGMSSLARSAQQKDGGLNTTPEPEAKKPTKKSTSGVTVRPDKNDKKPAKISGKKSKGE